MNSNNNNLRPSYYVGINVFYMLSWLVSWRYNGSKSLFKMHNIYNIIRTLYKPEMSGVYIHA